MKEAILCAAALVVLVGCISVGVFIWRIRALFGRKDDWSD